MLPLIAVVLATAGVAVVLLGQVGAAAVERARARSAADAAALAGALVGREEAQWAAGANGASLVAYRERDGDAWVRVRLGRAQAEARARRTGGRAGGRASGGAGADPATFDPHSPGARAGLDPRMAAAVARAEQLLGRVVPITSGYRSPAEQAVLWAHRGNNPFPVARPGTSAHERGLAIDVPVAFADTLLAVAARAGLCHPYPRTDPVHFELCARSAAG
ncbi:MAG TPA: M15 family metallopeptidase [Acidimicrobiales bacterium]|nr:M15 family metallopeptidase [Acidimicrobiales bacterium]